MARLEKIFLSKGKIQELGLTLIPGDGNKVPKVVRRKYFKKFRKGGVVEQCHADTEVERVEVASNYDHVKVYEYTVPYKGNKIKFTLQEFIWLSNQDELNVVPSNSHVIFKEDKPDYTIDNIQMVNKHHNVISKLTTTTTTKQTCKRKVRCKTTGVVYNSITEACQANRINLVSYRNLCTHLRGGQQSCGRLEDGTRLEWEYVDKE